jgi:hypothetical protein
MVKFASFTFQERVIVKGIVRRAVQMGIYDDPLDVEMDISATHAHCPLRLEELRDADNFNFGHDMAGIQQHLNRQTGKLEGFFLPRFAKGDSK